MRAKHNSKRLAAGVVVVRCVSGEYRYLLLRAYKNWDFPKGLVDPNETPLAAAQREAREETGLSNLEFRWDEIYVETEPYASGKIARYYVACTTSDGITLPVNPELGRPEHHEYRWLDYQTARDMLVPRLRSVLDWAHGAIGERC